MKATYIPSVPVSFLLTFLGLALAGPVGPSARAETQSVQPGGRIVGQWVTTPGSLLDYMNAILLPVAVQCRQIEGEVFYTFLGGELPVLIITGSPTFRLEKGHAGTRPTDHISFALLLSYQAPFTVNASEQMLEYGAPTPDLSSIGIQNLTMNNVEVMRESGDISMLGLDLPFVTARMKFEFIGDDQLKMTPIFPPSPDGYDFEPRPLILRRR